MANARPGTAGFQPVSLEGNAITDAARDRAQVHTSAGMCHLRIHNTFASAKGVWQEIENRAVFVPYQRFDYLAAWHAALGERDGVTPQIVEGRLATSGTMFIWPMATCSCYGIKMLSWLGGKHVNYSMGLYAPDALTQLTESDWRAMLEAVLDMSGADVSALVNNPARVNETANPLAAISTGASADPCHSLTLERDTDAMFARLRSGSSRKKLRRNIRRLEENYGEVRLVRARDDREIAHALKSLHAHKSQLPDTRPDRHIFRDEGVRVFLANAAHLRDGATALEIYVLKAGREDVATFGCVCDAERASGVFISIDGDRHADAAPGEVLIYKVLETLALRGIRRFDLGIGDGEYKQRWCHDNDAMFNIITGRNAWHRSVSAPALRMSIALKAAVKRSPALSGLAFRFQKH